MNFLLFKKGSGHTQVAAQSIPHLLTCVDGAWSFLHVHSALVQKRGDRNCSHPEVVGIGFLSTTCHVIDDWPHAFIEKLVRFVQWKIVRFCKQSFDSLEFWATRAVCSS